MCTLLGTSVDYIVQVIVQCITSYEWGWQVTLKKNLRKNSAWKKSCRVVQVTVGHDLLIDISSRSFGPPVVVGTLIPFTLFLRKTKLSTWVQSYYCFFFLLSHVYSHGFGGHVLLPLRFPRLPDAAAPAGPQPSGSPRPSRPSSSSRRPCSGAWGTVHSGSPSRRRPRTVGPTGGKTSCI